MSSYYRPRIRPYTWTHKDGTAIDGYRLTLGHGFLFVPLERVYQVTDALIDAHEQNEGND